MHKINNEIVVDSVNIDKLQTYLKPTLTYFENTNPCMQFRRDNKVQVNCYYYADKLGVYLFTSSLKPDECES